MAYCVCCIPVNRRQLSLAAKQARHQLADGHGLDEENKMKDYAFWRQFSKKPKIIPGCPVNDAFAYNVMTQHLAYWTCSSSPWPNQNLCWRCCWCQASAAVLCAAHGRLFYFCVVLQASIRTVPSCCMNYFSLSFYARDVSCTVPPINQNFLD